MNKQYVLEVILMNYVPIVCVLYYVCNETHYLIYYVVADTFMVNY